MSTFIAQFQAPEIFGKNGLDYINPIVKYKLDYQGKIIGKANTYDKLTVPEIASGLDYLQARNEGIKKFGNPQNTTNRSILETYFNQGIDDYVRNELRKLLQKIFNS